jgi:hypothetical protein
MPGIAVLVVATLAAGALPAAAAGLDPTPSQGTHTAADTPRTGSTGLAASKAKIGKAATAANGESSAESSAAADARASGKPVVVNAETTATTQVTAQPDGTFTLTSASMPVRVLQNGDWHPVDLALAKTAAGWAPVAAAHPVVFSPGGSGPLITETDPASGKHVSVSWPAALAAPSISGDAATYPNVLPGVDLQVEAIDTGYREVLIVHDAAAAADPGLRTLTFEISADNGVALSAGPHGALKASTAKGTAFTAGQPMAWDSTPAGPNMPEPGPDQVGATANLVAIPTTASGGGTRATLTLSPDAAAKRGPITYPYYIDPSMGPSSENYIELANFGANWPNSAGSTSLAAANGNVAPWTGRLQLGVCSLNCYYTWNGSSYTQYVNRDYFNFDTSPLGKRPNGALPKIYSAQFSDSVIGWGRDGTCDSSTVDQMDLFGTTAKATSSTAWPGPSGSVLATDASTDCPGTAPPLNALGSGGVCAGCTLATLGLAANTQSADDGANYWTVSDTAVLNVSYDFPVETPTGLSISAEVNCPSSATSAIYTSAAEPTLFATATDDNPSPLPVDLWFQVWNSTGSAEESWNTGTVQASSGSPGRWTTDDGASLPVGNEFRARAQSTGVPSGQAAIYSGWSGWFPFTDLSTPPSAVPTVTSSDYPSQQWGQPQGASGTFTLGTGGAANIAGFAYSFDGGSGSEPVPSTTDCSYTGNGGLGTSIDSTSYNTAGPEYGSRTGELSVLPGSGGTAQVKIPSSLSPGLHSLYVESFDYAHNASTEYRYVFYISPNYQTASQPIAVDNGNTLATGVSGPNASLVKTQSGNCCGVKWHDGSQLYFDNPTSGNSFTLSFNVADAGEWHLGANLTTSDDYGQYRVDLDGATSGPNYGLGNTNMEPFDGYRPIVSTTYLDLGTPYLTAGSHTLTFTADGKNSSSTGYAFGIDYLALSPTTIYQAYSNAPYTSSANDNTLNATVSAGSAEGQSNPAPGWLDDAQLFWSNTVNSDTLAITLTAPVESDYAIGADLTEAADYGNLRFDIADPGQPVINLDNTASTPIANENATTTSRYVYLDGVHLSAGRHTLLVTMDGTNSTTGNEYNAGISYLQFAPVTGATDASFTAAMNNHGIATDGASTTADFDLTGNNALSLQALKAAGITPGTGGAAGGKFTMNGVTYTMPQINADGDDNVIADGQTIPIPVPSGSGPVTGVGLLVGSTCSNSPAVTATVSYTSGQPSQSTIPITPDWTSGSKTNASVTMPYFDTGTSATPSTAHQPSLWAVTVPTNPALTPASITLPTTTATDFQAGACVPVLHVLAEGIATRPAAPNSGTAWVGAYAAPMDTTSALPTGSTSTGLTLSEVISPSEVYPTANPDDLMLRLSNAKSTAPADFDAVTLAVQGSAGGNTTTGTPAAVTFGGKDTTTVWPGTTEFSDPIALPSGYTAGENLVVSMHLTGPSYANSSAGAFHTAPDALTYYSSGNTATAQTTTASPSVPGSYYLDEADVTDPTTTDGTIAILGDQYALAAPAPGAATWASDLPAAFSSANVAVPGAVTNASENGLTLFDNGGAAQSTAEALYSNTIGSEPGLRDVVVSLGANDILALPSTTNPSAAVGILQGELTRLVSDIEAVSDARTGNPVQVILATIPSLGLSSSDVREQTRQLLNQWIYAGVGYGGTTATYWVDTAGAVDDSANPQNVNPTYLTGGVPNAAYYTTIATTIATAVNLAENSITPVPLDAAGQAGKPVPAGG